MNRSPENTIALIFLLIGLTVMVLGIWQILMQ
ncbi:protein MgtR [Pantoea allii]|nr:protein MgtR [Pantoea allii]MDJ0035450.1 protein MgtR [Pantoea allii]MDJ0041265.1 protein MgtR [Pantoea allii]NQS84252.1 protein MgtR [Pantoea allii]NQS84482.1 protein MgtR [Pantoea allii]